MCQYLIAGPSTSDWRTRGNVHPGNSLEYKAGFVPTCEFGRRCAAVARERLR
jgi:hypothetical protein